MDGIAVDLELVAAVFEVILLTGNSPRQLARLAHRNEARPQPIRHGGREDEASRLNSYHSVDREVVEATHQVVDGSTKGRSPTEKWGDVTEGDTLRGVIGDVTDVFAKPVAGRRHGPTIPRRPTRRQRRFLRRGLGAWLSTLAASATARDSPGSASSPRTRRPAGRPPITIARSGSPTARAQRRSRHSADRPFRTASR